VPTLNVQQPAPRLLVVDDVAETRLAWAHCLGMIGYDVTPAADGAEALDLLRAQHFDLVMTDHLMPGLSGIELTEAILKMHPDMPVVLVTGDVDEDTATHSLYSGASDFVTKPVNIRELPIVVQRNLTRRRIEATRLREREVRVLLESIQALASAVDAKDPYTARHSARVTKISLLIGERAGLSAEDRWYLEFAAGMHDVGKIGVPDAILCKPAPLTPGEWVTLRTHPAKGAEIIGQIAELGRVATVIRHHHERLDGTGYPDGLRAEAIPLAARIIGIADAFEAMTSDRGYRKAMPRDQAIAEIVHHTGTQFDPLLAGMFLSTLAAQPDL